MIGAPVETQTRPQRTEEPAPAIAPGAWREVALSDEEYALIVAQLGREPTAVERQAALGHVAKASDRRKAWEDVAWAVLNSKEFLLRH